MDLVTFALAMKKGGGSLPDPGAAGNVLTSTGDGWESAEPSGGAYPIEFSGGDTPENPFGANKSIADIITAIQAGKNVYGYVVENGFKTIYTLHAYAAESNMLGFISNDVVDDGVESVDTIMGMVADNTDTWVKTGTVINGMPAAAASDNGKFLGVVNGNYALVDQDYTVILTNDGEGGYTAAINGETVTLSELLVMAAAHKPLRVFVEIDNGRYITAPLTMWSTAGVGTTDMIAFTCPIILGTDTGVAAASCVDNGSGGAWTVGTV
ncbi:MAG: hypothetical protein IKN04_04105 [Clostridia bacterium]|nr:hypothetical protein [Clostridia bacterium]